MDSNHRPYHPGDGTGCEPSGLKPLPRTSRIPDFANRVVSPRWVAVWTTVWYLSPSLVQFFTRVLVPSNACYQNQGYWANGCRVNNQKILGFPCFVLDRPPSTMFRGLQNPSPATCKRSVRDPSEKTISYPCGLESWCWLKVAFSS